MGINIKEKEMERVKAEYQHKIKMIIHENINKSVTEIKNIVRMYNNEIIQDITKSKKFKNNEIVALLFNNDNWRREVLINIKEIKREIKENEKEEEEIKKYLLMLNIEKQKEKEEQIKLLKGRQYQLVGAFITLVFMIIMWYLLYKLRGVL